MKNKKEQWKPQIINIMVDGSVVDDLTGYAIPAGHSYYDIIKSFYEGGVTMKLFTKFKLNHERLFKVINLDWREVAVELMNDLNEERKRRFMTDQENYNLKQELAAYKYKENFDIKARLQGEM